MIFIIKRILNEVHSRIDEDLADNRLTEEQAQSAKGGANAALGLLSLELRNQGVQIVKEAENERAG